MAIDQSKLTQLQAEVVHILENEKLGASALFKTDTRSVSASGSEILTFDVSMEKIWKMNKIKLSGDPDTFYVTIAIDGKEILARQLLRENNSILDFPSPIFVRNQVWIKVENGTGNAVTISVTLFCTDYSRKDIDDFRRRLGF